MSSESVPTANVKQAVPFFNVSDMKASLAFYVDGLGFTITRQWTPDGQIRWCWLELGGAALMLQDFWRDGQPDRPPTGTLGLGVSICFMCADALAMYHEVKSEGIPTATPFVGNGLWDLALQDPDGYHLHFESPTDVPEDTVYSG